VPVKLRGGIAVAEDEVPEESDDNKMDDPNMSLLLPPSLTGKKGIHVYMYIYIYVYIYTYIYIYIYTY
jgi:hypothetical protein